ncbi:MAG: hypothetical protein AAF657_02980 [Acidobacteriota bacterium]
MSRPPAANEKRPPSRTTLAIERALDRGWTNLRLLTECRRDGAMHTAELFGNGVGLWNRQRQFELGDASFRSLLVALRDAKFGSMPDAFRHGEGPARPGIECRIALQIGEVAKQVAQPLGGEAPESFRRLADQILTVSREPGQSGVGADDLTDGLRKIASGQLASEVLTLRSNRKPSSEQPDVEGWVLNLQGSLAFSRSFKPKSGYGPPMRLQLDEASVRALARNLAAGELNLPSEVPGKINTTVRLELLNHQLDVRTASSTSQDNTSVSVIRFSNLRDELHRLHNRVMSEGQLVNPPPTH